MAHWWRVESGGSGGEGDSCYSGFLSGWWPLLQVQHSKNKEQRGATRTGQMQELLAQVKTLVPASCLLLFYALGAERVYIGATEGESHGPVWSNMGEDVDGVEEDYEVLLGEDVGGEGDAGHKGWDRSFQGLDSQVGVIYGGRLLGMANTDNHHVGLKQCPHQEERQGERQEPVPGGGGSLDIVDSVDEDLGRDDGDKTGLMVDMGMMGHINTECRVPLGELSPLGVVDDVIFVETIKATG